MKHDLRQDALKLRKYIRERLNGFSPETNDAPGRKTDPISLIHVGYENEQSGYVAIVFDTRPSATPDGEWTMHIEEGKNECEFPIWETCTESIFEEGPLELTTVKGETRLFTPESDEGFHAAFGEMIASEVLHAIDNGLFATLPRTQDCKIYVEEINGHFVWPDDGELRSV